VTTRDSGDGRPGHQVVVRGTGIATGIAHGPAFVLACANNATAPRLEIPPDGIDAELARFETAVARAEEELLALKQRVAEKIGASEADIFTAQALLLHDPAFRSQVERAVRDGPVNAEGAVAEVIEKFTRAFDEIPDPYLRERAADVRDVGRRVLSALIEAMGPAHVDVPAGAIVVTEELLPSATAGIALENVRAFVTERGGRFSHTAILARSLGTPAVVAVPEAATRIKTGDDLIVDGTTGVLFINPDRTVQREYDRAEAEIRASRQALRQLVDLPSVTVDGTVIPLLANVSKFADTEAAMLNNADGIGLYRTEFGFIIRSALPTEDEQFEFLALAAERFHPRKVVFRLLDIGGDKTPPYFPLPATRNPSLAERGIRLLLRHQEVLRRQLRAFLRVSAAHPISILVPVVGGVEEVRQTRAILEEVKAELAARGTPFDPRVPLGAMIEVPSAALLVEALAAEVDFFSLGTNDLVQYLLAADREDEGVAPYYQPLHPAVLRLIQRLAADAARVARPLTICGDMAGDPAYTELLVGLGLREMSVGPGELLKVKDAIRKIDVGAAERLAREALALGSVAEIEALLARRSQSAAAGAGAASAGEAEAAAS
jgi:phosphotransferase system enzyme I (PtsI)